MKRWFDASCSITCACDFLKWSGFRARTEIKVFIEMSVIVEIKKASAEKAVAFIIQIGYIWTW